MEFLKDKMIPYVPLQPQIMWLTNCGLVMPYGIINFGSGNGLLPNGKYKYKNGVDYNTEQERQGRLHVKLSCLSEHVRR